jgi:Spy/CpxP family protein refolding chaperone
MKKLVTLVAAVSIASMTALAYGEMGGHGMGPGMMSGCGMDGQMTEPDHHIAKHFKGLNLDEQQKASIGEIKSRMMKETIRRKADMQIAQIELKDLLKRDPVDMKAVEAKMKQLEIMKTEMHLSHIKAMEDCKARLTPEQRKKLKEMMEAGPMTEGKGMMHDQGCSMKEK